jgi:hypothetical protein
MFSSVACSKLNSLAENLTEVPLASKKTELGYFQALNCIYFIVNPLFEKISNMVFFAGFKDPPKRLSASPKAELCKYSEGTVTTPYAITEKDENKAIKEKEWIENIEVNKNAVDQLGKIIRNFIATELIFNDRAEGKWESPQNRDQIIGAAQKVVDTIFTRLLPEYCSPFKISEATPIFVNGILLPAFFTVPQMVAFQGYSWDKRAFTISHIERNQGYLNIFTQ